LETPSQDSNPVGSAHDQVSGSNAELEAWREQRKIAAQHRAIQRQSAEQVKRVVNLVTHPISLAVATLILLSSIAFATVSSSPTFAAAYCNAVTEGENSSTEQITIAFGETAEAIVAAASSPVFSCLTDVLIGSGDLEPDNRDMFSGYRFTSIDAESGVWGIYRP